MGGKPGDLYIKVHVQADKHLRREGYHLISDLPISVTEALLGSTHTVESLDGPVTVEVPPLKTTDEIVRVKGKGVPMGGGKRGDLLVRVRVTLPQKLTKRAQELLRTLKEEGM